MSFLEDLQKNLGLQNNPVLKPATDIFSNIKKNLTPPPTKAPVKKPEVFMSMMPKPKPFDAAGMAVNIIRTPFQAITQGLHDTIGAVKGNEPSAFQATDPIGKFILGDKPLKTGQDYIDEYSTNIQKSKEAGTPTWQAAPLTFLAFGGSMASDALGLAGGEKKAGETLFKNAFDDLIKKGVEVSTESNAYKLLREAGISHDLATVKAPVISSTTNPKVLKTILNDTAAEQIQTTQKLAQTKLDSFDTRVKNGEILSHADMTEQNFLKTNINKPTELVRGYQDTTPIPGVKIKNSNETPFSNSQIRPLTSQEEPILQKVNSVLEGKTSQEIISETPGFVSLDNKARPLVFSKPITEKIIGTHGEFSPENLVLNANDWEYVIKNVDKNPNKINLIKQIPNSDNFLTIGANRDNGFFIVTHYEVIGKNSEKLKNLLKNKGDTLDRSGRAVVPSFATTPEGVASQLDLSGVKSDKSSILPKPIESQPVTERSYITSAKNSESIAKDISSEISDTYTPKSNELLRNNAEQRVKNNFEEAKKFAIENSTDEAVATRVVIDKQLSMQYANATSDAEKASIATELKDSIISHARLATEEGRAVQANVLLGKQTPEGMLRATSKEIEKYNKTAKTKLPQISEKDVQMVLNKGNIIEKMPEGLPKEVAKKEIVDTLQSLVPSQTWRKWVNVYKAGLLTGVQTHGVNTTANAFFGTTEMVKNLPATGIDILSSLFTGERTKVFTVGKYGSGSFEGLKKGFNYLKTGVGEDILGKTGLEFQKVHWDSKPGKVLQAYTDSVYRVLGAEDMPFYYGALKRSLYEQALVDIKNSKKVFSNTDEKTKFIQNFLDNPSQEAITLADLDAKVATFRNDTALGQLAQGAQNVPGIGPALQMTILPFAKTPSAVATAMFNYTPGGILTTFYKSFKGGEFNQKEFAEGLGRVVTGFGALWLGKKLLEDKKITLGYPSGEKERAQWEAEGKTPNSILINGKWIPLITLGPGGSVMVIGAYAAQGQQDTGSIAGGVINGLAGGVKNLTEQTFLTGIKNTMDAANDPGRYGTNLAGSQLASIVPTIINNFTQAFDDYQRKSSGSILGPLKARIPGIRETLPKKMDVWGQPLERNKGAVPMAVGPFRYSNSIENILNTEVERLSMVGEDISPTKIDQKIDNIKLDDKEYYQYQKLYGKFLVPGLTDLINNKEYQSLSSEDQAKAFSDAISELKKGMKETVFPVIVSEKYDLSSGVDVNLFIQGINTLSKKSPEFSRLNQEKQKNVILNLMGYKK